jgi:transposase
MAMLERVSKPWVVILDNASIHTAKKLKPYWDLLAEKGMRFYFLPPYSPELNRIELLWHKMKYEWLRFKFYTPDELERAIDEIGEGSGGLYKLTFCYALIKNSNKIMICPQFRIPATITK